MQANPSKYYANYIRTYVERDVRLIKNITDLYAFERLLRLCAGRIGQLLNMSSLAIEVGVDIKTIGSWISILETSFILFRLQPHHKNFNKRIVKMPKLYFYDTGVATALLGVENPAQLIYHPLRGSLFENLVILEILKKRYNMAKLGNLFFWRDNVGNEVDLIIQTSLQALPVEIKSGLTVTDEFFKGIRFWHKLNQKQPAWVVYAGNDKQKRSENITVLPLSDMKELLDLI
jgi:predicted AAA+ superfamily ATPase